MPRRKDKVARNPKVPRSSRAQGRPPSEPLIIDAPGETGARPLLVIDQADYPAAARDLAARLAGGSTIFQRGEALVKLIDADGELLIRKLNTCDVVNHCHSICRPVVERVFGGEVVCEPVTLPDRVARLYMNLHDEWSVHHLAGICRAPILADDGTVRIARGYDPGTRYWCAGIDMRALPEKPSRRQAEQALKILRSPFASFPFADACATTNRLSQAPDLDESTFLTAILTAVCRPSLPMAPGFIFRSPQYSGAGTGKGKLVRAISRIAFDYAPRAFTIGDRPELDKRLTAAIFEAAPVIFIDNVNAEVLRSNLLAQIVTENPCAIRPFGQNTKLVSVATTSLIAITGNAVGVSEDLARRFLTVDLDAGCEDPEGRSFAEDILVSVTRRRHELLAAALIIWRWGRRGQIKSGLSLGSFEQWSRWVRDPLISLGCADPVRRIVDIKRDDPRRIQLAEFFSTWYTLYGDRAVKIKDLDIRLRKLADPHGLGSRQSVATFVANLSGTRSAGFVFTRSIPAGKWSPSTYTLRKSES